MSLDLAKQRKFYFKLPEKFQENQIQMKLVFNQNHPNDQKMMSKFELVQTKQFFRVLNKQYSRANISQNYYHTRANAF